MVDEKETNAATGYPTTDSSEAEDVDTFYEAMNEEEKEEEEETDSAISHPTMDSPEAGSANSDEDQSDTEEPEGNDLYHKLEDELNDMTGENKFLLLWDFYERKYGNAYVGADPSWITMLDTTEEEFKEMSLETGKEIVANISSKIFIDRFLESEKCDLDDLENVLEESKSAFLRKKKFDRFIHSESQRDDSDSDSYFDSDDDSETEDEIKYKLEIEFEDMGGNKRYAFIRWSQGMLGKVLGRERENKGKDVGELRRMDAQEIIKRCIVSNDDSAKESRALYRDLMLWKKYIPDVTREAIDVVETLSNSKKWGFLWYLTNGKDVATFHAYHIIEKLFFQGVDIVDFQTITEAVSEIRPTTFIVYCLYMFDQHENSDSSLESVKGRRKLKDYLTECLTSYVKNVNTMKAIFDGMEGFDSYYFFYRKKHRALLKVYVGGTGSKTDEHEHEIRMTGDKILDKFFESEYYFDNDAPLKDLLDSLQNHNNKRRSIEAELDDMDVIDQYSFFFEKYRKELMKDVLGEQGSKKMNDSQKEILSKLTSTGIYMRILESDYYTRNRAPLKAFLKKLQDFKKNQKEKKEIKEKLFKDLKVLSEVPEGLENVRKEMFDKMSSTNTYKEQEKKWNKIFENPDEIMNNKQYIPLKNWKEMQRSLGEHLKTRTSTVLVDLTKSEILQIIEEQMSLGCFLVAAENKKRGNRCTFENETLKAKEVLENMGYDLDGKNTTLFDNNPHRPLRERFSGLIERRVTIEEIQRFLKIYSFEEPNIPQEETKEGDVETDRSCLIPEEGSEGNPDGNDDLADDVESSGKDISALGSIEKSDDDSDKKQTISTRESADETAMKQLIWRLTTSDIIQLLEDNKEDFPRIEKALPEIIKNKELGKVDKTDFLNSLSGNDLVVVLTSLFDNNSKEAYNAISRKASEKLLEDKNRRKNLEAYIRNADQNFDNELDSNRTDVEIGSKITRMSNLSFEDEVKSFRELFHQKYDNGVVPSQALKNLSEEIDLGLSALQTFDKFDQGGNRTFRQFVQQAVTDMSIEEVVKTFLKQIPAEVAFMLVAQNEKVSLIDFDKEKLKEKGWWNPENAKSFQPTEIAWQNTFNIGMGIRVTAADGNMGSGLQVFKTLPKFDTDNDEVAHSGLQKILVKDTETLTRSIESSLEAEGSGWGASASASARAATKLEVSKKAIHATVYSYCIMGPTLPDKLNNFEVQDEVLEEFKNAPDSFREKYGTHFIAGYKKGATFFGKMTYSTTDENKDLALESSIQLSPPLQLHGPKAKTSSHYKNELQKKNIDCTTEFVSTGGMFMQGTIEDGDMHALLTAAQETIHGGDAQDTSGYIKVTAILYPYEALKVFQNTKTGRLKYQRVVSDKALRELSKALLWYGKLEELCNDYVGNEDRLDSDLFRNIKQKVYGEYQDRVREYSSCPAYDDYILDHIRLFRIDTMKDYEKWLQSHREAMQIEQARNVCRLWPFGHPNQQANKEPKKNKEAKSVNLAEFNKLVGEDIKLTRIVIDGSSHKLGRHMKGSYLGVRLQKASDIRTAQSCYVCAIKNRVFVHDSMQETNRVSIWSRERVHTDTFYIRLFCNLDKTGVFAQGWYLTTSGNYLDDEIRAPVLAHHQRCYAALWKYVDHPKSKGKGKALMIMDGDDDGFSFTDGRKRYLACLEKKHDKDTRGTFFEDSVYAFLTTKKEEAAFIRFEEADSIFTKDKEEQKLRPEEETPPVPDETLTS